MTLVQSAKHHGTRNLRYMFTVDYSTTAIFCTCGSNNWVTVEDRLVHAARGLTSIELSVSDRECDTERRMVSLQLWSFMCYAVTEK